MAGIVCEGEGWFPAFSAILLHVGDEPTDGAGDVVIVHRRGTNAGKLRPPVRAACALLDLGDSPANGAATESTGSEGEGLEKSVVEFLVISLINQLFHGIHRQIAGGTR